MMRSEGIPTARPAGFSLVEILIAMAVIAFGLVSIGKLQVQLIRAGGGSKARTTAVYLAQRKMDDLRDYSALTGTPSYSGITNNGGGQIAAGTVTMDNATFTLAWTSDDYYYSGFNSIATTTVPTPTPSYPDFKQVQVTVSWTDAGNEAQSVVVETAIAPLDPRKSGLVARASGPLYVAP